jgi:hypothetical protein
MTSLIRRTRGIVLRIARRRLLAFILGVALIAPALWMQFNGGSRWWAEGLGLVLGATGAALLWTGLVGTRPDWVD